MHKIPFKCVEISFSGLKKRGKFGENKTLPQVKKNKTKNLPLKALSSRDARPEGRRRRRRRQHGVGRKRWKLPAMSRTTLLVADGRRVVAVGGESTTIELTVSNAI